MAPTAAASARSHAENNFNLLRLLFALMVVAYHLVVLPAPRVWAGAEGPLSVAAQIGVQGFFILSGYLVYASLERSASLRLYAEKRARRLYPGYAVVIVICALAALAFVPQARADLGSVVRYLGWNLGFANFMAPSLPGVFETHRFSEINGALWTLKIEVLFYLLLPLLAWLLRVAGPARWLVIAALYVGAEIWRASLGASVTGGLSPLDRMSHQLPGQMSFFITGMAFYRLNLAGARLHLVGLIGAGFLAASLMRPEAEPVRALGLGAVAVWIATGLLRLPDAARFGDLSYGIYIVHFPIIQTAIALGLFASSPFTGAALALGVSVLAALLLWHLVEKPSLRRDSAYRGVKD